MEHHLKASRENHVLLDGVAIHTLSAISAVMGSRQLLLRTLTSQARTAIALERYRADHGSCPKSLAELVPTLMPSIPEDPVDGHPMRYRVESDGTFKLWSIAMDDQDDGGVVLPPGVAFENAPSLTAQDFQGDWVWSHQILVPEKQD